MKTQEIQLTWIEPGKDEKSETIYPLPLTIGRDDMVNTIGLPSNFVSDEHARLEWQDGQVIIIDLDSKNGTYVDGSAIDDATPLEAGSYVQIGPFAFTSQNVTGESSSDVNYQPESRVAGDSALRFDPITDLLVFEPPRETAVSLPELFQRQIVPMAELTQLVAVDTTTYLAIGGGIGSFTWVDHLLVSGAKREDITVIGFEAKPYGRYQRLCQNSQIPGHERLRSNSDSCPDNVWGWPGYAVREMWSDVWNGRLSKAAKVGWQIFNEPYVPTYTPKAEDVFNSIDREAERIGWDEMWQQGRVRAIRKTDDGRYAVAYSAINEREDVPHKVIICNYLHLAVGYPGVRFLSDLQAYRQQTGDFEHVVNAYEAHDHIYESLKENGGTVLVRGRGIVASRIIQRLYEIRTEFNVPIGILHLMRTPLPEGHRYQQAQREVNNHWEFQPFNWPKAAWGGALREKLAEATPDERDALLNMWGGTTTADRPDWREMVEEGLREGWYEIQFGSVYSVAQHASGGIATRLRSTGAAQRAVTLLADYVIDATGLDSAIDSSPLLRDLVTQYELPRNPKGRLAVTTDFELDEMRQANGRFYASGVCTLGGPYAPVDSFLGLQFAAFRSVDDLTAVGAPGLRRLNGLRSIGQWLRWVIGIQP